MCRRRPRNPAGLAGGWSGCWNPAGAIPPRKRKRARRVGPGELDDSGKPPARVIGSSVGAGGSCTSRDPAGASLGMTAPRFACNQMDQGPEWPVRSRARRRGTLHKAKSPAGAGLSRVGTGAAFSRSRCPCSSSRRHSCRRSSSRRSSSRWSWWTSRAPVRVARRIGINVTHDARKNKRTARGAIDQGGDYHWMVPCLLVSTWSVSPVPKRNLSVWSYRNCLASGSRTFSP